MFYMLLKGILTLTFFFTMIERRGSRPPVTYTTFQARDLGGDTAELVKGHNKRSRRQI